MEIETLSDLVRLVEKNMAELRSQHKEPEGHPSPDPGKHKQEEEPEKKEPEEPEEEPAKQAAQVY